MDHRNDELMRLSECIESLKSEVKQKMRCGTVRSGGTKVTGRRLSEKSFCERAVWLQMRHSSHEKCGSKSEIETHR
jgi:hypothetical protein